MSPENSLGAAVAIWTVTAEKPLHPTLPALFHKEFKSQRSECAEWTRCHEKNMKHLNKKEDRAKIQQNNDESRSKASLHNQRLVWQAPAHSCFTLNHILYTFPNLVIWGTTKSVVLNGRLPLVQTRFPFTRMSFNSKMLWNIYLQHS